MKRFIPISIILFVLTACNNQTTDLTKIDKTIVSLDSQKAKKENTLQDYNDSIRNTIPDKLKTVLGYRFLIKGDFDGDGKIESLIEHFLNGNDRKETNKFYEDLDYNQLVILTIDKNPISLVNSDNQNIDTLFVASNGQLLGLSHLKNEGDLNGDGSDEISYVVNWADWSNINTCHLMTYKDKKWKELYSFGIWDWQLPDLPETFNQYGLFGLEDKVINASNDSINEQLMEQLNRFSGFIKKIKNNKIQVRFRNEEASEDTIIVDLKNGKQ